MSTSIPKTTSRKLDQLQELVDEIITYLHDDPTSLKQCSLVNSTWLPASSRHLFYRMRWPPCPHAWALPYNYPSDLKCRCPPLDADPSTPLKDLMGQVVLSARIRQYLKEFEICCSWSTMETSGHKATSPGEIMDILEALPGVKVLVISHLSFTPEAAWDTREATRSLDKLKMHSGDACSHLALNIIRYFTNIRELNMNSMWGNHAAILPPPSSEHRPQINHLILSTMQSERDAATINNLCTHVDFSTLTALTMPITSGSPHPQYNRAFHTLLSHAPNLSSFAGEHSCYPTLISHPTQCRKLTTLELRICGSSDGEQVYKDMQTFPNTLDCSVMSNIEEFTLQFIFSSPRVNWEPMGDYASESLFRDILLSLDWPQINRIFARLKSA